MTPAQTSQIRCVIVCRIPRCRPQKRGVLSDIVHHLSPWSQRDKSRSVAGISGNRDSCGGLIGFSHPTCSEPLETDVRGGRECKWIYCDGPVESARLPMPYYRSLRPELITTAKMPGLVSASSAFRPPSRHGFTFLELMIAIAIITVLASTILVVVAHSRSSARGVACLANLRNIHHAFLLYGTDNQGHFPDPEATGVSWEQSLKPYLPDPSAFRCATDEEVFPSVGSSYDWRDAGSRELSIAGCSIARVPPNFVLAFDCLPGWHAQGRMNAVLVDGAAVNMDQNECLRNLQQPVQP
jgi:prepilin-type N-terminal cleavage/methylation domain-containing protein